MEAERIGKKKWRSFKIRWGFIYCCAKPRPSSMARHDTMAINKNHDDDVYEILPVLEQEEPISTITKEGTQEAVDEAEAALTGYSTISFMGEEEEENKEGDRIQRCCVCEGRPRGAALIQCGHTFCRLCAREMWLTQFDCPLCHRPIQGILDIF